MVFGKEEYLECSNCKFYNNHLHCWKCNRSYRDMFSPIKFPSNGCICLECKKLYDMDDEIDRLLMFPLEEDNTRGICYECY